MNYSRIAIGELYARYKYRYKVAKHLEIADCCLYILKIKLGGRIMWTKPEYTEMRFGFEVTMYIANR